jgi:thioredoxin-dependent peroxiredoxin
VVNHSTSLKVGDKAPDFSGTDQDGKTLSLKDLKGKKVVLFFYPKDDTPGCTTEACNLRDNYSAFKKKGYTLIGVSADSETKHKKFIKKYELPFPLIADVDHIIIKAYDVWGRKQFMGREFDGIVRTTFVIDEKGVLEKVITNVKTKEHSSQII